MRVCVLERPEQVEVGSRGDPDRRWHSTQLGPLFVRNRLPADEADNTICALVTYNDLRVSTSLGRYAEARQIDTRRSPPEFNLRPTRELLPSSDKKPGDVIFGLSFHEARLLCESTGGRLPTQFEIEAVVARLPALKQVIPPTAVLWSSEEYGMFDYCFCRFDKLTRSWVNDATVQAPSLGTPNQAAGVRSRSVLQAGLGMIVRHSMPEAATELELETSTGKRKLQATALIVFDRAEVPR